MYTKTNKIINGDLELISIDTVIDTNIYSDYNNFTIIEHKLLFNKIGFIYGNSSSEISISMNNHNSFDYIIDGNLFIYVLNIPKGFYPIINGDLIIKSYNNYRLNQRAFRLSEDFINHISNTNICAVNGMLHIETLTHLPKGFYPNVKGKINLPNLESKMLKELILYPGPKRQLAFNLLKMYYDK